MAKETIAVETPEEITQAPLTEEEEKVFDGDNAGAEEPESDDDDVGDPEDKHEVPEWAVIPPKMKLPAVGVQMVFLRIPAKWTHDPSKGDRQCVLWPLEDHEEVQAYQRSRGDHAKSVIELAKACIKICDGEKADWTKGGATSNVTKFWKAIGPKGRHMIRNYYAKTHLVTAEEALDFFSNHFVAVTVQPV